MKKVITNWSDLDREEQVIIARGIYTVEFTDQFFFSFPGGGHDKKTVKVDHRSADIDVALADIVRWLWQNDMETIASCENRFGSMTDGTETAYISFLSDEYGGTLFFEILGHYQIHSILQHQPVRASFRLSGADRIIRLRTAIVSFRPGDTGSIRKAIANIR